MNDSTRKLGTRYDKPIEKQDERKIRRVRISNPALSNTEFANEEQIRRAEIAHSVSTRIGILMASGRFCAAFDLLAEAQAEMAPRTYRPSSPIEDVLGAKISQSIQDSFGCETLLHLAGVRESELLSEPRIGPVTVGAIKKSLEMVGLTLKPESLA